jgi:DNA-binding transcriptional regulator YhcF (GntR family)
MADEQILSSTQISEMYKLNPATVIKGINILVDEQILYKQRGIGMFVSKNAFNIILYKRRNLVETETIKIFVSESKKLGLSLEEIIKKIKERWND